MKPKKTNRWLMYCEPCGYRRILEEGIKPIDLVEIPTSPIPGGAPKMDPATKKVKTSDSKDQKRKYKCPNCGRGVSLKDLPPVYQKALAQQEKVEAEQLNAERQRIQEERAKKEIEQIGELNGNEEDHTTRH